MNNTTNHFWDADVVISDAAKRFHNPYNITSPFNDNPLDLTIFVSCYNEQAYIADTLDTIASAMKKVGKSYEIIVIDDGSKDNSIKIVSHYIEQHPDINLILRINKKNKGLAQNFIDGAFIGRGKYYRLICGDNAEPIETMIDVFNMMGQADIIVPYYVSAQGKSFKRRFISKLYTWIINLISGNKINYYNGLHVHLRYNVMRWHPNTRGFGFQAGLLCLLLSLGCTYKQAPCITIERRCDDSGTAISWKNLRSVIHTMFNILLRRFAP